MCECKATKEGIVGLTLHIPPTVVRTREDNETQPSESKCMHCYAL